MKEKGVEHTLKFLYVLQQVDSQAQEIHELKGDLPATVESLQSRVDALRARIAELETFSKQSKINRDQADVDIIDLAEKVEKYKEQQLNVKSNKQYDALTREIEAAEERTSKLEKEMEVLEGKMQVAKTDVEALQKELDEVSAELDERERELKEVNKEHEKEELRLQHERDKVVTRLDKDHIERYERIKQAKGGKAVVPVRRNACGGCYSRIPPQKILELRKNLQLFTCETCGRILVSDKIVEESAVTTS